MISITKVDPPNASNYFHLFEEFKVFRNYFHCAFEFLTPETWVDSLDQPSTAVMYTPPAYFFSSDPQYRRHGLGKAVRVALLEHCLNRGIDPEWDAPTRSRPTWPRNWATPPISIGPCTN